MSLFSKFLLIHLETVSDLNFLHSFQVI